MTTMTTRANVLAAVDAVLIAWFNTDDLTDAQRRQIAEEVADALDVR